VREILADALVDEIEQRTKAQYMLRETFDAVMNLGIKYMDHNIPGLNEDIVNLARWINSQVGDCNG
jgi:hypothetical protein